MKDYLRCHSITATSAHVCMCTCSYDALIKEVALRTKALFSTCGKLLKSSSACPAYFWVLRKLKVLSARCESTRNAINCAVSSSSKSYKNYTRVSRDGTFMHAALCCYHPDHPLHEPPTIAVSTEAPWPQSSVSLIKILKSYLKKNFFSRRSSCPVSLVVFQGSTFTCTALCSM